MKQGTIVRQALVILLGAVLSIATLTGNTVAGQKKMIFLPFRVRTEQAQEHLRDGLTSILASRLSERSGQEAIYGAGKTNQLEAMLQNNQPQEAKKILQKMQGSELVLGSLEQHGTRYTLFIQVLGANKTKTTSFTRTVASLDKVIPVLDDLAAEIANSLFHVKKAAEELPAEVDQGSMSGFQTMHPDKMWRDEIQAAVPSSPSSLGNEDAFRVFSARSSSELANSFQAMDAGDVDGDGQDEFVLVEHGRLLLLRAGNKDHFRPLAEYKLPGYLGLHTVYLADVDNNGRQEIYISASNGSTPSSIVLEWDGRQFRSLNWQVPYYLRPDKDATGKPILLGQSYGKIYQLIRGRDGNLTPRKQISVPAHFDLYDFIQVDLNHDGRLEFIGLTEDNTMLVLDQTGTVLWKSEDFYGASREALGTVASRRSADLDHPYADRQRTYLHTRLIAQDLTGDGKPEIIVSKNQVTHVKFFKNLRYFEGASIVALSWDGRKMNRLWETAQTAGYIIDCQLRKSLAQPGRFRLFWVESDDTGNPMYFWTRERSTVHFQEIGLNSAKKEKQHKMQ
jgi:TolB-like protein